MKIKLHNSMSKVDRNDLRFLFNNKIFLSSHDVFLRVYYQFDDNYCFLKFYHKTKEFEEGMGFGGNYKILDPIWLKIHRYNWKQRK